MSLVGIILTVIGLVLDVLFIYCDGKYHGKSSIILKTSASLMFVVLAIINCHSETGKYIVIALSLNMVGDFILILRNVFPKYHDLIYGTGTLSFLVGHIFLSVYLIELNKGYLLKGLLIDVVLFVLIGIYLVRIINVKTFIVKVIGTIYVFIIMCTLGISISRVIDDKCFSSIFYMIATLIFALSDVMLIIQKFEKNSPKFLQPLYRIVYYISQLLFAIYLVI